MRGKKKDLQNTWTDGTVFMFTQWKEEFHKDSTNLLMNSTAMLSPTLCCKENIKVLQITRENRFKENKKEKKKKA